MESRRNLMLPRSAWILPGLLSPHPPSTTCAPSSAATAERWCWARFSRALEMSALPRSEANPASRSSATIRVTAPVRTTWRQKSASRHSALRTPAAWMRGAAASSFSRSTASVTPFASIIAAASPVKSTLAEMRYRISPPAAWAASSVSSRRRLMMCATPPTSRTARRMARKSGCSSSISATSSCSGAARSCGSPSQSRIP
mmetsp:Transcript_18222/g.42338  ORF Transcript_18222/g.42338 Transcript_18222/m.42338 type:complete len:201 (+) Transcript_18222:87-689(+)